MSGYGAIQEATQELRKARAAELDALERRQAEIERELLHLDGVLGQLEVGIQSFGDSHSQEDPEGEDRGAGADEGTPVEDVPPADTPTPPAGASAPKAAPGPSIGDRILEYLREHGTGTPNEIRTFLGVPSGSISSAFTGLGDKVCFEKDPNDGRVRRYRIREMRSDLTEKPPPRNQSKRPTVEITPERKAILKALQGSQPLPANRIAVKLGRGHEPTLVLADCQALLNAGKLQRTSAGGPPLFALAAS